MQNPETVACFTSHNAVITSEIKLFQNYFSLRRCPSEIILSARGNLREIISKLFQSIIAARLYFSNMFKVA